MGDHRSQARHREGTHRARGPFRVPCGTSTTAATKCAGCAWNAAYIALHRAIMPSFCGKPLLCGFTAISR